MVSSVLWDATSGDGELTIGFCQTPDPTAVGTGERNKKEAAEAGSDDLHQLQSTLVTRRNDGLGSNDVKDRSNNLTDTGLGVPMLPQEYFSFNTLPPQPDPK